MNRQEHNFLLHSFLLFLGVQEHTTKKIWYFTLQNSTGLNSFFFSHFLILNIYVIYWLLLYQHGLSIFFASIYSQHTYEEQWNLFSLVIFWRLWGLCSSGLKPDNRNKYHLQLSIPPLWWNLQPSAQGYLICLWMNSCSVTVFFTWVY